MNPEQIQSLVNIVQSVGGAAYKASLAHAQAEASAFMVAALILQGIGVIALAAAIFWLVTDDDYDKSLHVFTCFVALVFNCFFGAMLTSAYVATKSVEWSAIQDVARLVVK